MTYSYVIRYRRNENSFLLEKIKDIKSWLRKKRLFVLLKQSDRMSWFRQNRTWCSRSEPLSIDLGRGIIFLCFLGLWGTSWNLNSFGAVHPFLGSSDPTQRQDQGPGSSQAQRRGQGECTRRCFLAPIFGGCAALAACQDQHLPSRTSSLLVSLQGNCSDFPPLRTHQADTIHHITGLGRKIQSFGITSQEESFALLPLLHKELCWVTSLF